jgi:hypothetical protein
VKEKGGKKLKVESGGWSEKDFSNQDLYFIQRWKMVDYVMGKNSKCIIITFNFTPALVLNHVALFNPRLMVTAYQINSKNFTEK